jgi:hypothetical protein
MKKGGQFYLIAALVIVVLLVGFIGLTNYTKVEKESSLTELQKELETEIAYTLDYGSATDKSDSEFRIIFQNLSSIYINKSIEKTTIFLYGKAPGTIVVRGKTVKYLNISINVDGSWSTLKDGVGTFEETYTLVGESIALNISNTQYAIEFNEGQNFKYLIFQGKGKENLIIQG